jgi:hypothetical protein
MSVSNHVGKRTGSEPANWFVPARGWILGPTEDLLLFLGTPLLLVAAFDVAERYWNLVALGFFSTALAMGQLITLLYVWHMGVVREEAILRVRLNWHC